uniref:Uncharacterized protein n=1 Tax=viral metagenome TaxID=1070528 RepID=A0A6M3J721_9ZZZZ
MEIRSVPGTGAESAAKPWWRRFGAEVWQDWSGVLFFWRHNWSDFTLIQIMAECETMMGNATAELALIGFHLRLSWYWPNANRDGLLAQVEALKAAEVNAKVED